jgi:phage baseplate assembly protein W
MFENYGKHLSFPFRIGDDGRTVQTSTLEDHVREELMQLILTNPGERLFLPEFGGGIRRLVFENADPSTEGIAKAQLTQAINRWLGNRITLIDVNVAVEEETIEVYIKYQLAGSEETRAMKFQRNGV